MPRETAAQKKTRIAMLLADFANRSSELRKLQTIVDGLKEQVREIAPGTYGEWSRADGTPREILDQKEAKRLLIAKGIDVPMVMSQPPLVVKPVAGK
jgi:uncharacterized protein (DUF58 family)